jgi:HAD superfamily phosphatase (TIGR01668 family)
VKNLENLVVEKLGEIINLVLSKIIIPDISLENVTQLDEEMIARLKAQYGIQGIILDVDETIRKNMKMIPKCNQEWLRTLKCQLKVIIVSNGVDKQIEQYLAEQGIDYIGFAHKPLKINFIKACKKMGIEPENVLVVGNDLFDDIFGGKRNNMKTALIKDVVDEPR